MERSNIGVPREDRKAIVKAIQEGDKAVSSVEVPILADNMIFLRNILVAHHGLCIRLGIACEDTITDEELGSVFFHRIDWSVGLLSPLNSWLYGHITHGFDAMVPVAKDWCMLNTAVIPTAIEAVSANFAAPASFSNSGSLPCFSWDDSSCAYERTSGNKCNFSHPRGQDTRRARSGDRSRSRSRDRGQSEQNGRNGVSFSRDNGYRSGGSDSGGSDFGRGRGRSSNSISAR